MQLDPRQFENAIFSEFGLEFEVENGIDTEGQRWYSLRPKYWNVEHEFCIRTTLGWRRIFVSFEAGKFAADLLNEMGNVEYDGRIVFVSILSECERLGAKVEFCINDKTSQFDDEHIWNEPWSRLKLTINKGNLELGVSEGELDEEITIAWTKRFVAAVIALLPLEENQEVQPDVVGYPEGALTTVQINRYERDRRNRAAAIAIHGTTCRGCGINLEEQYGAVARGCVEIHHVTPVAQLGKSYKIDPVRDLVPLCPNCHTIAHRRNPPFSAEEIGQLLASSSTS